MSDYEGFRLKIKTDNDYEVFPEDMIAAGTFEESVNNRRVIADYYTADGKHHIIESKRRTANISFSIRKRRESGQERVKHFFDGKKEVDAMYWTGDNYQIGTFRVPEITYKHAGKENSRIIYGETQITLEGI